MDRSLSTAKIEQVALVAKFVAAVPVEKIETTEFVPKMECVVKVVPVDKTGATELMWRRTATLLIQLPEHYTRN